MRLNGIHHITCITADARRNLDFYTRALGLRFVKKTVNFDAPDVYHLYYGDELGRPGTVISFFEFRDARPGRPGDGMITRVELAVPGPGALDYWAERLAREGCALEVDFGPTPAGEGPALGLGFIDPDGLALGLVADFTAADGLAWAGAGIPPEHAIRGFHGATATVRELSATRRFLLRLGFRYQAGGNGGWFRTNGPGRGHLAYEVDPGAPPGLMGAGSVHHIDWATPEADQSAWRTRVREAGGYVTDVLDRMYFKAIYFREPGGVLVEIATEGPGFAADEPVDALGRELRLPPWLEPRRRPIEAGLTRLPEAAGQDRS